MSNVLSFYNREDSRPSDLMSFREIMEKYKLKYGFLYKWAVTMKKIPVYDRGGIVISEADLLCFLEMRGRKWQAL